jgi:heat shock protein HslJ
MDNRFETSSVYIGKSNRAFTERGNWSVKNDSIVILNKSEENARQFKVKKNRLVMLNQQGEEVTGSLAQMYVLLRADSSTVDQRWEEWREQGIDFHAADNEPSWSLNIDFDKMMTFKTLNGDSITTPVPQMQADTATKARVWNAEVESGSLVVELYPSGCLDDMSGEVFNYRVNVSHGDKTYTGCGSYINSTYKLNDFWQLQTLNGSELNHQQPAQDTPSLQFDVANKKVYGSTGCNRLNGTVVVKKDRLLFSKMATTKRACPGNMESRFLSALQKVQRYAIANAELLMMSETDTLMVFRRAE